MVDTGGALPPQRSGARPSGRPPLSPMSSTSPKAVTGASRLRSDGADEAHRTATEAVDAAHDMQDNFAETIPVHLQGKTRLGVDDFGVEYIDIVESDDPRWIASERAVFEAWNVESMALIRLLTTAPTTLAGAAALVGYIASAGGGGDAGRGFFERTRLDVSQAANGFHGVLAGALARMAAAASAQA